MSFVKLAVWLNGPYRKCDWFNPANPINRDGLLVPYFRLQKAIEAKGGICQTQEYFLRNRITPDIVLFLDAPEKPLAELLGEWNKAARNWLIIQECEVIMPHNWDLRVHAQFEKIFTWHDEYVDNAKYIKLNPSQVFPEDDSSGISGKSGFCVIISGNKCSRHPLELYSKRIEAVRWFEANHPGELDLYGRGWDEYQFTGVKPVRALNRLKPVKRLFAPYFPSYKGVVEKKLAVLKNYRYSVCYENAKDIPGYITEKIFDCFFAGVVPIYWGAPNIADHIPDSCFIDKRKFRSYDELYLYIKNMPAIEYEGYQAAIKDFLAGPKSLPYSADFFVNTILKAV